MREMRLAKQEYLRPSLWCGHITLGSLVISVSLKREEGSEVRRRGPSFSNTTVCNMAWVKVSERKLRIQELIFWWIASLGLNLVRSTAPKSKVFCSPWTWLMVRTTSAISS